MIFNFTNNFTFSTRTQVNENNVEIINQTKLLGVTITNDLKWEENTKMLVKKANSRMQLLRKVSTFTDDTNELTNIYNLFIRSILEQSCVVWHSCLTNEDSNNLERIQKSATRIILKEEYNTYEDALTTLNITSLYERRLVLCVKFAKNTTEHKKLKSMFPKNENNAAMQTRDKEEYKTNMANTERYKNSSIPFMQRILNGKIVK